MSFGLDSKRKLDPGLFYMPSTVIGQTSLVAQTVKASAYNAGDPGSIPALGRSPGEGNGNPLIFLPGKSHGQRSLAHYSPWGRKESDMTD